MYRAPNMMLEETSQYPQLMHQQSFPDLSYQQSVDVSFQQPVDLSYQQPFPGSQPDPFSNTNAQPVGRDEKWRCRAWITCVYNCTHALGMCHHHRWSALVQMFLTSSGRSIHMRCACRRRCRCCEPRSGPECGWLNRAVNEKCGGNKNQGFYGCGLDRPGGPSQQKRPRFNQAEYEEQLAAQLQLAAQQEQYGLP